MRALCVILLAAGFFSPTILPERASASSSGVEKVLVVKGKRILILMRDGEILKAYRIALGRQPVGHKIQSGDKRTPEGSYILDSRNPNSRFHRALHLSYPSESDISNARKLGVSPGGDIMIHGLSGSLSVLGKLHRSRDWTDGCIAVTNEEIEEIWCLVPDGTPIEIRP
jgi:murein L,D-transpeptidase YafK